MSNAAMEALRLLQTWYSKQCNGQWEHSFGIKIETIDNPGWSVEIDLKETELSDRRIAELKQEFSANDWLRCFVKDAKFYGYGDPSKLELILSYFLRELVGNLDQKLDP